MAQLVRIKNYTEDAHTTDTKGLARLHFIMAIAFLQQLIMNLHRCVLNLESVGEQPHEWMSLTQVSDIETNILDS